MPFSKEMILGSSGNQGAGAFYEHQIGQSLLFDEGGGDHLQRTPSSAGNRQVCTFSCWTKRSNIGVYHTTGLFQIESIVATRSY